MQIEEYIKKYFTYSDGVLHRTDRRNASGSYDKDGYLIIKVKGKQFKAHRLVWLLCKGVFPEGELDHINRIRNDNRIENLRIATRKEQVTNRNLAPNKDTGVVGVYLDKNTRGLLARYTFRHNNKCFRFRSLTDAIQKKGELQCNA